MTVRLLHSPALYDLIQQLAGEREFRRRLAPHLRALPAGGRVIDIGGGTGLTRQTVPSGRYVCMDLDFAKLRRFRGRRLGRLAVLADAARCPFATGSVDGVLCAKVVHHLNDGTLEAMLSESARILRPGGVLILVDAARTARWTSRMLWRLDRGSFPRSPEQLRSAVPKEYAATTWEEFRIGIFHDFVLCSARRREESL